MKYPPLVPDCVCNTSATIIINTEDYDEDGAPVVALTWTGKCNYQDKAHTILTAQKELVTLSGTALINGDIAPSLAVISGGKITVNGVERKIYSGQKARNPDGTVNYTRIEVV